MRMPLHVAVPLALLTFAAPWACSPGIATDGDGGVGSPGPTSTVTPSPGPTTPPSSGDAASPPPDGSTPADGASSVDAGAFTCAITGGTYTDATKTCTAVADCGMVARGCYCGSQPVVGVNKAYLAAAQACETKAGMACPLGCVSGPGQVAEDGKLPGDGGVIVVKCALGKCLTVVGP